MIRRSWSRSGPGCGASAAASAPMVANTPAPRAAPGVTPPATRTATVSGRGRVTAKRTTSRHGTGGGLVRTSSSSQAGACRPRARSPPSATPEACHPRPLAPLESAGVSVPLRELLAALDARYDPALAESWDAVGLVCGDPDEPVRRVVFAVDPTPRGVGRVLGPDAALRVPHQPPFP